MSEAFDQIVYPGSGQYSEAELAAPGSIPLEVHDKPLVRASDTAYILFQEMMSEFNKISGSEKTEVMIGCHSVGNLGHGIGPSIAWFNPLRLTFEIRPTNMFSIELFAYTAAPEWGGAKVRIPLEDDAIVTERGVEWLYPVNERILLIR